MTLASVYEVEIEVPCHTPVAIVPRIVMAVLDPTSSVVGSPELSPIIITPSPKTDMAVIAPVPDPSKTPPSVRLVAPVPPLLTAIVSADHVPVDNVPTAVI